MRSVPAKSVIFLRQIFKRSKIGEGQLTRAIFHYDTPHPEGDWIGWRTHVDLAGSYHHATEINDFVRATRHLKAGMEDPVVTPIREPQNKFDPTAVKVTAGWASSTWLLGYLPMDLAKDFASEFSPWMPLAARLIRISYASASVYVKVQVLVPSKKAREAEGLA